MGQLKPLVRDLRPACRKQHAADIVGANDLIDSAAGYTWREVVLKVRNLCDAGLWVGCGWIGANDLQRNSD